MVVGATYSILQSVWDTAIKEANAQESCNNRRRNNMDNAGWKATWRASSRNWVWRVVLGGAVPHRNIGRPSRLEANSHGNQTKSSFVFPFSEAAECSGWPGFQAKAVWFAVISLYYKVRCSRKQSFPKQFEEEVNFNAFFFFPTLFWLFPRTKGRALPGQQFSFCAVS